MKRRQCICVRAFEGKQETRVLTHPRCPVDGNGGNVWRLAAIPPVSFLRARRAAARGST